MIYYPIRDIILVEKMFSGMVRLRAGSNMGGCGKFFYQHIVPDEAPISKPSLHFIYLESLRTIQQHIEKSKINYIATEVVKKMIKQGIQIKGANILMLGITFKENCPDIRNSKVVDVIKALKEYDTNVTIYDTWANPAEVKHEYGLEVLTEMPKGKFGAVGLWRMRNLRW
jgi:hypothetical protein